MYVSPIYCYDKTAATPRFLRYVRDIYATMSGTNLYITYHLLASVLSQAHIFCSTNITESEPPCSPGIILVTYLQYKKYLVS